MKRENKKGTFEKKIFFIIIFIISIFSLSSFVSASGNLILQPSNILVSPGEQFNITVQVDNIIDLYGFQLNINYDSSAINYTGIEEGDFLKSDGATTFFYPPNSSTLGLLKNLIITRISVANGISGSGILAKLKFKALNPGSSNINISNDQLLDSNLNEIAHSKADSIVNIGGCMSNNDCKSLDTACSIGICNAGQCSRQYNSSTTICRASAGVCDIEENCTGSSENCPVDSYKPDGTSCAAPGLLNALSPFLSFLKLFGLDLGIAGQNNVCRNGQCVSIICNNDLDCNDNNINTEDKCINPGTTQSYCTNLAIACFNDNNCGTNGFIGDAFCQSGNVFQNFINYTCNNPGTSQSSCTSSTAPQLKTNCQSGQVCSNGQCIELECKDSDGDGLWDYDNVKCPSGTDKCPDTNETYFIANPNKIPDYFPISNSLNISDINVNNIIGFENFSIKINNNSEIIFKQKLNLIGINSSGCFEKINFDNKNFVNLSFGKISLNDQFYNANFNKFSNPAKLIFYGINYINPVILKDDSNCTECNILNYSKGVLLEVDIPGFSTYEIKEGPVCGNLICDADETCSNCASDCGACVVDNGNQGGGGGGGGETTIKPKVNITNKTLGNQTRNIIGNQTRAGNEPILNNTPEKKAKKQNNMPIFIIITALMILIIIILIIYIKVKRNNSENQKNLLKNFNSALKS